MSEQNRRNEYNRLKALGRDKDIPENLIKEFEPPIKPAEVPKPKPKKKKGKK